jgi:hypothetical protein
MTVGDSFWKRLWGNIWSWLDEAGKRAWVLVLVVSLLSLSFVIANYRLTKDAQRPNLVSASPVVNLRTHPETVIFDWGNFSSRAARRGAATLYTLDKENKHPEKIDTAPIVGAGTNVLPTSNGRAQFRFDMQKFLGRFLVCVMYFDDQDSVYEQAYLFGLGETLPDDARLDELAPPDVSICARSRSAPASPTPP